MLNGRGLQKLPELMVEALGLGLDWLKDRVYQHRCSHDVLVGAGKVGETTFLALDLVMDLARPRAGTGSCSLRLLEALELGALSV